MLDRTRELGEAPVAIEQRVHFADDRSHKYRLLDRLLADPALARRLAETARTHCGDCTEHAVLLAALGRAAGALTVEGEHVERHFLGMTFNCAKCHDHMYDPISQSSFYAMKALFDPLVTRKVLLDVDALGELRSGTFRQAPCDRARRVPRNAPHPVPARTARLREPSFPFVVEA